VVDTKLKRRADPKHALQLSLYSRAVAAIQGVSPERAHVVFGTGERISLVLADVQHYAGRLARRLEQFVSEPWRTTTPEPVAACGLCRWRDNCDSYFDATDSLVRVAGITRIQRRRLEAAGVSTLAALACHEGRVPHMTPQTSQKLELQARLQFRRREGGPPAIELKPLEPGRGFANLPKPSEGDLFFDMEGDPLVESGLEYLFGVYFEDEGNGQFRPWWAHDAGAERESAASVLAFFCERLTVFPNVDQYAPAASLWERKADGGALIVFDAATFKEVKRIPMDKPVGTCTTRSRGPKGRATEPCPVGGLPQPPSCGLPQSLKVGAFLAMLDIMASVRSWLMSMAAFQVAM
jgi:uncharacterized protein